MNASNDSRPLVLHVVNRFDTGGLENGVVNLINHMPTEAYRHAVMALTDITAFKQRVTAADVVYVALNKSAGHGFKLYPRVWRALRELKPAIVHTRNLGPLEMQVAAAAARVPVRIHGEHGRELNDLDGRNRKLQSVRRLYAPFVHRYVALSRDLQSYLVDRVGVDAARVTQIYNGVDAQRFVPAGHAGPDSVAATQVHGMPFETARHWIVGTVGRMQGVKDQTLLARAFVRACAQQPQATQHWRLLMVGDGPLLPAVRAVLGEAGLLDRAWLPGERADVAALMQQMHCFVLPSKAEGVSNTILEAMACGLPVLATRVGGNAELVHEGRTGLLVPAQDDAAMAQALLQMQGQAERTRAMGLAGRQAVESRFSLQAMVAAYQALYDTELAGRGFKVAGQGGSRSTASPGQARNAANP